VRNVLLFRASWLMNMMNTGICLELSSLTQKETSEDSLILHLLGYVNLCNYWDFSQGIKNNHACENFLGWSLRAFQ
jgi:hypothetical protein